VSAAGTRRALLWALVLVALGGLLLHYRVHPYLLPDKEHPGQMLFRGSFLVATLLPLFDLIVVTTLFLSRRTAALAFLINGLLVVYGTVLMGHFSIAMLAPRGPSLADWFLKSTFPDIALAWGDFMIGKALYASWMQETEIQ
jgi:hypothetical protein